MQEIQGVTFSGQTFCIDDKKLIDCTLIDCVIEYAGGHVILERTALLGCRYVFVGNARMTLQFLECVGLLPVQVPKSAAPAALPLTLVH